MNKFAFIIHPIEVQDFYKRFPILKKSPIFIVESIGKLLSPFKVSKIKGISTPRGETEGYLIAIPLTLKQMLELSEEQVIKKIIKAGNLAKKLGVDIIGLEAYTTIIDVARDAISENLSIPITTGRAYTILSAVEGIKKAASMIDKDYKECEIIIIGIDDEDGSLIARYLAREAKYLTLVSRNRELLEDLSQRILTETGTAIHATINAQSAIERGDIIIVATNSEEIIINPKNLKHGAIICDLSRPRIVTKEIEKKRQDVLFIDGSMIELSGNVDFGFDFGFPSNTCYASMAETILLALEKRYEYSSFGDGIEKIDIIKELAKKNNFSFVGLCSFNREVVLPKLNI